ncbi:DUF397 domain-containing protein [Paractinoplanes durhamensis]|uniref:DUF397 domain-containing protein n=1 Tax=Paractinoplanes durhamensis TaxID=113563 RepID=UPI00364439A5
MLEVAHAPSQRRCLEKGSRSNGSGGNNCVEVAILDTGVAVRDSKDRSGPALMFTQAEWIAFVDSAKDGEFDVS